MPSFRAACVEQKIVEVPKRQVIIAFVRAKAAFAADVGLESDLAIYEQAKEFYARETFVPPEVFYLLRDRQHREEAREARIANLEQCSCARDSSTISLPRRRMYANRERTRASALLRLWRSRPVAGNLRLDNDQAVTAGCLGPTLYSNKP